MPKYQNRREAGKILAHALSPYQGMEDVLVLALPRGGVPVGFEVADWLRVPLDVFIVRKLGVPGYVELAFGAVASGGMVLNQEIVEQYQITDDEMNQVIEKEKKELVRREKVYRGQHPFPAVSEKTVILVDDGIATGASMRAAIQALRGMYAQRIIVAVPVADVSMVNIMEELADEFICPMQTKELLSVGSWYDDFSQTEDEEVSILLKQARHFSQRL